MTVIVYKILSLQEWLWSLKLSFDIGKDDSLPVLWIKSNVKVQTSENHQTEPWKQTVYAMLYAHTIYI